MTPIKYSEVANLLCVDIDTLRHAVSRGALTRLPRQGQIQPLIKEQAMLFNGKRLSLKALNERELEEWERLAQIANSMEPARAPINPAVAGAALAGAALGAAGTYTYITTVIPGGIKGVPQGDPFQQHQNLLLNILSLRAS